MTEYIEDYKDVPRLGDKIVIKKGGGFRLEASSGSPNGVGLFAIIQIMFVLDFARTVRPIGIVPLYEEIPEHFQGLIPACLVSDKEGMFGRQCPSCKRTFRMTQCSHHNFCAYCGLSSSSLQFMTEKQKSYLDEYVNCLFAAMSQKKDYELELETIADSPFKYSETTEQSKYECESCKTHYDIEGIYGFCPNCGQRNSLMVLNANLQKLQQNIESPPYDLSLEKEKYNEELLRSIEKCVSIFQGFANDIKSCLAKLPALEKRRDRISKINFQDLDKANSELLHLFEINLFKQMTPKAQEQIKRCFCLRHVINKNNGVIDEKYLQRTNDQSYKVGQAVRGDKQLALTMIALTKEISSNLFCQFKSMFNNSNSI